MLQRAETETFARWLLPANAECMRITGAMHELALIPATRNHERKASAEPPPRANCGLA